MAFLVQGCGEGGPAQGTLQGGTPEGMSVSFSLSDEFI